jgi:alanine racemase
MDVNLNALKFNLEAIQAQVAGAKVMAVVKANAYGHGLERCGLHFESCGADSLGCAYLEEALILRSAGVKIPILVFGGIIADQIERYINHNIDLTASSVTKLEQIEAVACAMKKSARVHIKIDTGMERIGVHYYSADSLLEKIPALKYCDVVGVFSHFACADREDQGITNLQLERFQECLNFFTKHSLQMPIRHIANSAAVMQNPATYLDMVRPGIALYGVMPSREVKNGLQLKPVMSIRSKVVYFKVVKKGAGVSYSHLWHADKDSRVVTIPLGYGDGYPRALSNRASVLIRGKRYPVVGAVCMDQLMVNIGQEEAYNGDDIIVVGNQGSEQITIAELSSLSDRTAYELLVGINARLPRLYTPHD